MKKTSTDKDKTSEIAIFARLLSNHKGKMSPPLSRYILGLGFSVQDQKRMEELAQGNQDSRLSPGEHEELMNFVKAGHLLALLHSKARKALKSRPVS